MQAMQHNLYQLKGALRTETTNGIPLCRRKLLMSHNGIEIISTEKATYCMRAIYNSWFVYYLTTFWKVKNVVQGGFFQKNASFMYG